MLRTGAGDRILSVDRPALPTTASVIVPVLNEEARLGPCLEGLLEQGPWVREILVVDGGSTDATKSIVARYAQRDARLRVIPIGRPPADWNGKAWGLDGGLRASSAASEWVIAIDADVRPAPNLTASLLEHAARHQSMDAFSAAPRQRVADDLDALIHPALLATLVYRQGLPGTVATRPEDVQANGQCFVAKRETLVRSGAIAAARSSRCEDLTIARTLAASGVQVGFFEAGDLASVEMYASAEETWSNWPRSLPLRDGTTSKLDLGVQFAEVAFVQALPLAILLAGLIEGKDARQTPLFRVNAVLTLLRLGVLAGTRRIYVQPPATYWLSPLADLPAVVRISAAALSPTAHWRGQPLVEESRSG
jgi:dolichol-phosphate mannosyltransferase